MKIERNSPCRCGSGKKYKKCCLPSDDHFVKTTALSEVEEACDEILAKVEAGNLVDAESDALHLYYDYPEHPMVNFLNGVLSAYQGLYEEAILLFQAALEADPMLTEAYFNLGHLYRQELMLPQSVACFRKILEIEDAKSPTRKVAQQALDDLEQIVQKSGHTLDKYLEGHTLFDQAFDLLRLQKYREAIALFQQVLELDPRHVQSYGNMGIAYSCLGEQKKALDCLDQALILDPTYGPALNNREMVSQLREGEQNQFLMEEMDYYKDFSK